jgi:transposase
VKRPGKKEKRLNIVAGLCENEVISPVVYDWTTKHGWFEVWFEWHLCPNLRPNSAIIIDNASWHRKSVLEGIAKFYGFKIFWLPSYSPDKNRIEHLWANLKAWLQYYANNYANLMLAIQDYFKSF